jgi:hypothetical protein
METLRTCTFKDSEYPDGLTAAEAADKLDPRRRSLYDRYFSMGYSEEKVMDHMLDDWSAHKISRILHAILTCRYNHNGFYDAVMSHIHEP